MTDTQRLKLISYLVESDVGFESDCVMVNVLQGRKVSNSEKVLAELVSEIYKIVHPRFSKCKHGDWERESEDKLKLI